MKRKVLLAGSSEVSIYNFRKELVERLIDEGFEVIIASPYGSKFDELIAKGCIFIDTPMNRRSKDMIKDVSLFKTYVDIMKKYKPDVLITYTIKPNLYASLAAQMMSIPYIMNITGLGTEIERDGISGKIIVKMLKPLLIRSNCVFFQNTVHIDYFKKLGCIKDNYRLVAGSGVNIYEHRPIAYPEHGEDVVFLYVGRLMPEKGIRELVKATKNATKENKNIKVYALGFCEESFKETFKKINADNTVKHLDYTKDVDSVIAKCDAVILPSYHEGMSNALLEGASCARPLLASNVPGCREIINDGETGLLFTARDSSDMAKKMLEFAKLNREKRIEMGKKSRKKIEKEFDRDKVVDDMMQEIYCITKFRQEAKKEEMANA